MRNDVKSARLIYETFCKLQARNSIRKRGRVLSHSSDSFYTPEKAIRNFYNAILKADEITALEQIILVALRDLSPREVCVLRDRLKKHCSDMPLAAAVLLAEQ